MSMASKTRVWLCIRDVMSYKASRNDGDQTVKLYLNAEDIQYNAETEAVTIRPRVKTVFSSAQDELDNSGGNIGTAGETGYFSLPKGTMGIKVNARGAGRSCFNMIQGASPPTLLVFYYNMHVKMTLLDASDNVLASADMTGSYTREDEHPYYHNYNWNGTLTFNANLAPDEATPYKLAFSYTSDYDPSAPGNNVAAIEDVGIVPPDEQEKYMHPNYFGAVWDNLILTLPASEDTVGSVNYAILEDYEDEVN